MEGEAAQPRETMERAAEATSTLTLLVVSARPPILAFFETIGWRVDPSVVVEHALPDAAEIEGRIADDRTVSVVVVDVGLHASADADLCRRIATARPELATVALLCCPSCVTPATTSSLVSAGVRGLLDLRATPRETLRMLRAAASGETVLHISLGGAVLRDALSAAEPKTVLHRELLELIAHGLPDHEIGRRLHLSPHTVKRHVEALRGAVGARNRIELAAWAGRNGFYRRDASGA